MNYITNFKDKKSEKKIKDELEKYFDNGDDTDSNDKHEIINKKNLSCALRWFICLVLFGEKDKKKKIKENKKNIVNYLDIEDLWEKSIYNHDKFKKELNGLKELNITVNKIIWLYDYLIEGEEDEDFIQEIEDYLKNKEEQLEQNKSGERNEIILNSANSNDN
jgi:hypothetical protein